MDMYVCMYVRMRACMRMRVRGNVCGRVYAPHRHNDMIKSRQGEPGRHMNGRMHEWVAVLAPRRLNSRAAHAHRFGRPCVCI